MRDDVYNQKLCQVPCKRGATVLLFISQLFVVLYGRFRSIIACFANNRTEHLGSFMKNGNVS